MMEQQCSSKPNRTLGNYLEKAFTYYLKRGDVRQDWFKDDTFYTSYSEFFYDVSATTGTAFNVFFNVKFSEGKLPINGYLTFREYYRNHAANGVCMSFPFGVINNIPIKARRAEVIFSRFFSGNNKLVKYKTTKGEMYYVGNGIILNSKFEPIIIPYYNMSINCRVNGVVFKISSSVFTNKSGLIEKFIVKHLLPWIEYTKYVQSPGLSNTKVPLSIEITSNFKDYITIPNVTKGNPTTDVNKFLKENKQALINQIWAQ